MNVFVLVAPKINGFEQKLLNGVTDGFTRVM